MLKGRDAGDVEEGFEEDEVDNADKKRSAQFNGVRKEYIKRHLFRKRSIFIGYGYLIYGENNTFYGIN